MENLTPDLRIKIDGARLEDSIIDKLIEARVNFSVDKSDMFKLTFSDKDFSIQNSNTIDAGKEIIVELGYNRKFEKVVEGEIVRVEFDFESQYPTTVTIIGFDKMYRLNRTKKSRSFNKIKVSDIAHQIAKEMGLSTDIEATTKVHEYLFQNNQSNLDFLKQQAKRLNYEVEVEDNKLVFKKARHKDADGSVTLKWDKNLTQFNPIIDYTKVVEEVEVTGWDAKNKKLIKATAKAGDEKSGITGNKGTQKIKPAFASSNSKTFQTDTPISSQEEAKSIAQSKLEQLSMQYLTTTGTAIGEPKIKIGKLIQIVGVGDKLSGNYYITGCEHIFSTKKFITKFEAKRGVESEVKASNEQRVIKPKEERKDKKEEEKTWVEVKIETDGVDLSDKKYIFKIDEKVYEGDIKNNSIYVPNISKTNGTLEIVDK
jgi:phage protein D